MEERNFKGIWIPKEIWLTNELSLQEKVVLVEIDSLDDEKKGCYASNKYFADFFNLSCGRVSQIIKELYRKGYLNISYNYQGKEITERVIKINKPPYPKVFNLLNTCLENDRGVIKKTKGGYLENCKENNISINNINNKEIYKERFKPPTLLEIEEYCKERNNNVDAKRFYDYYTIANWKDSKGNPVKNWKQKMIANWENKARKQEESNQPLPTWFDNKVETQEMTKEEQEEIDKLLKNF